MPNNVGAVTKHMVLENTEREQGAGSREQKGVALLDMTRNGTLEPMAHRFIRNTRGDGTWEKGPRKNQASFRLKRRGYRAKEQKGRREPRVHRF